MISIYHLRDVDDGALDRARQVVASFAAAAGCTRASLGRSVDDPAAWVLVSEWTDVGAYRRGLGAFPVKATLPTLMGQALEAPNSYEVLVDAVDGALVERASDLSP